MEFYNKKSLFILLGFCALVQGLKCRSEDDDNSQQEFQEALRKCIINDESNQNENEGKQNWSQSQSGGGRAVYGRQGISFSKGQNDDYGNYGTTYKYQRGQNRENEDYNDDHRQTSMSDNRGGMSRNQRTNYEHDGYSNFNKNGNFNNNNKNMTRSNNNSPLQQMNPCIVHCVFRQMQMLDSKSFPDKDAVISIMVQSLREVEVKDFIEETVEDCMDKINSTENNHSKCQITKTFALCLENKGRLVCDDW